MRMFALSLLALCSLTVFSQSDDKLPELIERTRPSVVAVVTFTSTGSQLARGTGFVVSEDRVITNYHVIEGASRIQIKTFGGAILDAVRIAPSNKEADLALLQVDSNLDAKPLRLAPVPPRVGERIFVLGNPLGLSGSVSDGIISATRKSSKLGTLLQITAPISPGSSGSPVLNASGEVVGLATMDFEGGQNLNFAIAANQLTAFVPSSSAIITTSKAPTLSKTRWRKLVSESITYDTETWTLDKGIHSVWIKYVEKDHSYEKILTQVNCMTGELRPLRSIGYDSEGSVLKSSDSPSSWQHYIPETNGEDYYKIFCKDQPDDQYLSDYLRKNDLIEQGSKYDDAKNYQAALETYGVLAKEFPTFEGFARYKMGSVKLEEGKLDEAIALLREAARLEPTEGFYYDALASAYEKKGDLVNAKAVYWNSLTKGGDKRFKFPWHLINIYTKEKNEAGIADVYVFFVRSGELQYYDDLAASYQRQGRTAVASQTRIKGILLLEARIRTGKATSQEHKALAALFKASNNPAKCESTLKMALRQYPDDYFLLDDLAQYYLWQKRPQEAITLAEMELGKAKQVYEKSGWLRVLRDAYLAVGRKDDATRIQVQLDQQ